MSSISMPSLVGDMKRSVAGVMPGLRVEVVPNATDRQPTLALTFEVGTPMRAIKDSVIQAILKLTRGERKQAAQILGINPRTIRRRVGRKSAHARSGAPV